MRLTVGRIVHVYLDGPEGVSEPYAGICTYAREESATLRVFCGFRGTDQQVRYPVPLEPGSFSDGRWEWPPRS